MESDCLFDNNNTSKTFKDTEYLNVINGEIISKHIISNKRETLKNNDIKISSGVLETKSSIENIKIKKIVECNQDIMWFDYQSLFDKTKNAILWEDINIQIAHTNFRN